jgi:hypothetical protein
MKLLQALSAASVLFAVAAPTAITAAESGGDSERELFPIICLLGPPVGENVLEHWQLAKQANFTVAVPSYQYDDDDHLKMLDHCQKVGLKGVVHVKNLAPPEAKDSPPVGWQSLVHSAVDRYADHPALYGYMIRDEPGADLFPQLGRATAKFQDLDLKHPVCINLFPVHATEAQLQTKSYVEYLDRYMLTVKPPFLCYDHYPFLLNNKDRPDFFLNLELVRTAGMKHDTPIWTVVLSGWGTLFRKPTPAELRWQVYGAMAYGVRGLVYFAYWPTNDSYAAVVDYQGRPQPIYETLCGLNENVLRLGTALQDATSTGVFHTGESLPQGCTGLPQQGALIDAPQSLPLVIGLFQHKSGNRSVMIVNRDYRNSVKVPVRITNDAFHVRVVATSEKSQAQVRGTRNVDLTLTAGGATLLSLRPFVQK